MAKTHEILKNRRARVPLLGGAVLLAAASLVLLGSVLGLSGRSPEPAQASGTDVTCRLVPAIPPGTTLDRLPPKGWSHVIVLTRPRVADDSADQVSESTAKLVSLLSTAILADVQAEPRPKGQARFFLSKIAAGVATKIAGQETIVSSDTHEQLGADLGWIGRAVLAGGEEHVQKMRCVARCRTMAILDFPTWLLHKKEHREMVLRYAVLVAPRTGRLDTLVWLLEKKDDEPYAGPIGPIQRLTANMVEDCPLHVDPDEFLLGFPTTAAFARKQIPAGRRPLDVPKPLKPMAATARLTKTSAEELQRQLTALLATGQATRQAAQ